MSKTVSGLAAVMVSAAGGLLMSAADLSAGEDRVNSISAATTVYDFTVKDVDGNDVNLAKYKGDVCLVVNVASK